MVKITDVARKAGVAKSTVSNVLTGRKYVSPELCERVLAACSELDFQTNFYASALSGKRTHIIALLLEATPEIAKYPFYKDLIMACLLQAAELGYSLLVYYENDKMKLLQTLRQGRSPIDGAVLLAPSVKGELLAEMESNRTVCVVVGRPSIEDISHVDIDNKKLVRTVAEKLIGDYGRDIFLINSSADMTISQDRTAAFAEICRKHGIELSSHLLETVEDTEEESYWYALKNIKKNSVFITANETRASGVYRAANEKGLVVGRDVGVFSLGRSVAHGKFSPKLSYALQNYDVLGRLAVSALIKEIETQQRNSVFVESELIFRESTSRN